VTALSDGLLALVPTYGVWLMAAVTFFSCLALPVPCSLLMLTAGGFVASGDLVGWQVTASALAGAVAGDQTGFAIGRFGGEPLLARIGRDPKAGKLIARAVDQMDRRGAVGVFFTRWLFSAVGPYVNFAAGATGWSWGRFTIWGVAGEAVWVGLYIALGYGFAGNIDAASDLAGSMLGILAGVAAMLGFGYWLVLSLRAEKGRP
jgi:membrane-associated protein